MYTKQDFARELKKKIFNKEKVRIIGNWAYSVYFEHMGYIDKNFERLLLKLSAMEEGPQFARSYEELDDIADRLIAGEDVTL